MYYNCVIIAVSSGVQGVINDNFQYSLPNPMPFMIGTKRDEAGLLRTLFLRTRLYVNAPESGQGEGNRTIKGIPSSGVVNILHLKALAQLPFNMSSPDGVRDILIDIITSL